MRQRTSASATDRIRRFNRFYTRQLGILDRGLLGSDYSLSEARVLYEIARRPNVLASQLGEELNLDRGYLSRILARFARKRLLERVRAKDDGRRVQLRLTAAGRRSFEQLDLRSTEQIEAMTRHLSSNDRDLIAERLDLVENALSHAQPPERPIALRAPGPGDLGWIVQRHGALYASEFGWDARFEGLVARIVGDFAAQPATARQRAWIAERDGRPVGCVLVVEPEPTIAQLRLLLVDPEARGCGLGHKLVAESVRYAREAGYRKMILWTNSVLNAARRIYEAAGFQLVKESPHESFGVPLVGQFWELRL